MSDQATIEALLTRRTRLIKELDETNGELARLFGGPKPALPQKARPQKSAKAPVDRDALRKALGSGARMTGRDLAKALGDRWSPSDVSRVTRKLSGVKAWGNSTFSLPKRP